MSSESQDNSTPAIADPPVGEAAKAEKPFWLSVVGLLFAIVALGLLVIPVIAFEQPLPNPFAKKEEPPKVKPVEPKDHEAGVTLKYKSFSVTLSGKKEAKKVDGEKDAAKPEPQPEQKLELTKDPMRRFSLAGFGCALVALCVAPVAHVRERHLALTLSSMGISVGALTWQYLVIGIFAGAAVAAFFIVLAILGQGLG